MKTNRKNLFFAAAISLTTIVATNTGVQAATQGWDADGTGAPATVGGTGNWLGGPTWYDTTTNAYASWLDANIAVLGGTAGTVTVNGNVSAAGVQLNSNHTIDVSGGNLTMTSVSGTNVLGSTITNSGGTARSVIFNNASATAYSGLLSGTNLAIAKQGAGALTLSGNNSYGGGTTHTGGDINVNHNNALGSGAVSMSGVGAPRLIIGNGVVTPSGNSITIGTTTNAAGRNVIEAATTSGATSTVNGTISITGALSGGGHFGMNGSLTPPAITPILVLNGAISSTVTIVQRNATVVYGGGGTGYSTLQVSEGTARVKNTNGISTAATVNLNSNTTSGTLDLAGNNQSLVAVNRRLSAAATVTNSVAGTISTLTLTGTNLTGNNTGSTPVAFNSFIIANGAGTTALTVNAPSNVVTLGGVNTYTGATTVKAGTLALSSTGSIANSTDVTVGDTGSSGTSLNLTSKASFAFSSTQTLRGIGTVNIGAGKTVTINGTHAAGGAAATVGAQSITGDLSYGNSSTFEWDLNAISTSDPGVVSDSLTGTYDQVTASGTIGGAGSVFKVVLAGNAFTDAFWDTDKSWSNIFTASSSPTLSPIFTSFSATGGLDSAGAVAGQGAFSFTGSSLNWTAVPEPSSTLVGLVLGAGLFLRRRRVK